MDIFLWLTSASVMIIFSTIDIIMYTEYIYCGH